MIRLALRFDDPSATSDRAVEEGIVAAAGAAGMPLTLAVIPFRYRNGERICLSEGRVAHLIRAHRIGVIEVAQHGYAHEPAEAGQSPPSEFRGVDFEQQLAMIREGRSALVDLFGAAIAGFVPPWNTFDAVTTRALAGNGFRYLSAGWDMDANCVRGMSYLPRTCQMTALLSTLDAIAPFASLDPVVIGVMHHYDFAESGNPRATTNLTRFGMILQSLRRDPRLQITTLSELADAPCTSLSSRLRQNGWRRLPWRVQQRLPRHAMFHQHWPRLVFRALTYQA